MFLSETAKRNLPEVGFRLCMLYSDLSAEAKDNDIKALKFSPKHHLFLHLCEWQGPVSGNPKFYWVYADEDMVGHMIEVAHSCHPATMASVGLFKWRLLAFP